MSGPPIETGMAIETVGLGKRFKDVVAVDGLNLAVPKGTVFGFIGPNGAGKSTTLRMLVGLIPVTSGEARILGRPATSGDPELKQRIGYVPETSVVYRWMNVGEALGFCRTLYENWNDELCSDLVARFQLPLDQKIRTLSRGMSAKLSLLLAMAYEPEVLILDEPTSGLDPIAREEFLDGILSVLAGGSQTVLFSSHTLGDVQRMADNIGILCRGRLLAHGATDELVQSTQRLRIVLRDGASPDPSLPLPEGTIRQHFGGRQWQLTVHGFSQQVAEDIRRRFPVEHLEVEKLGLEEIFKDFIRGQEPSS